MLKVNLGSPLRYDRQMRLNHVGNSSCIGELFNYCISIVALFNEANSDCVDGSGSLLNGFGNFVKCIF